MSETTVYEKALTSDRSGDMLAQKHGFEDLAEFAESLPENAWVMDLGAGMSPFGNQVAELRPDITWVNFDYSYNDPDVLEEASREAPANVHYVAGDATQINKIYPAETFDAVVSYWLFPHLSIDDRRPAEDAARGVFKATRTGGFMSIGATDITWRHFNTDSYRAVKDGTLDEDEFIATVVNRTALSGSIRYATKLINEVATPFFGTTRYYERSGDGIARIADPDSDNYLNPLSLRGVGIAGRLALALARHAALTKISRK